ncbi:MAG: DUF1857 family protein [Bacteroidia bacterium]|nr:DUF1857 family protein [Bacteroidia bacterium]
MVSHSEIVKAPIAKVWEHFIFKIDHPENFVPGVSDVKVLEKKTDYTLREMSITMPDGKSFRFSEKITHAPYWVKFLIAEHPVYSGYVDNVAEAMSDNETKITYSIYWTNKSTGEVFNNTDVPKNAVLKTVDFILKHNS